MYLKIFQTLKKWKEFNNKINNCASPLLWTFQVAVNDLVLVEVVHAGGDLHCPIDGESRRQIMSASTQKVVQCPVRTIFHHQAIIRCLSARTPGKKNDINCLFDLSNLNCNLLEPDNVWMMELTQVPDICFFLIFNSFDSDYLVTHPTFINGALSARCQPFQIAKVF